jgi:hypothetical protein
MRATRFSIGSLLALIAILGVALAALRSPSYLWANAAFTVALAAIVAAIVNVVLARGADRAYWLGFALFGGTYLAICSTPVLRDTVCPHLVTEAVFDMIYPFTSPAAAAPPTQLAVALSANFSGSQVNLNPTPRVWNLVNPPTLSAPPPPYLTAPLVLADSPWTAWTAADRSIGVGYRIGSINLVSSEAFRQIGHSLTALLAATLGGLFARNRYVVYARDREPLPPPVGQASA